MTTIEQEYADARPKSRALHARAAARMPSGVAHDGRAFAPFPFYVARADGAYKWDVDGHRYVDCWSGHGALMLGHNHPAVQKAILEQARLGTHYSACSELEVRWAELICSIVPGAERVRFMMTGTETTALAIRVARAATGRQHIVKFEAHFHGLHDAVMAAVKDPFEIPVSAGVPPSTLSTTLVARNNDLAHVRELLDEHSVAAVILEPAGARSMVVPTNPAFLRALREVTSRHGIALIFDEVITFRVGYHGAQGVFGVTPDLTTLGKIIGGGFPVGAVVGRADVMAVFDPTGGKPAAPHGGTFNANPVTMAAGLAGMRLLTPDAFGRLDELGAKLRASLEACFKRAGVPGAVTGMGSLFRLHPTDRELIDYRSTRTTPEEDARLHRMVRGLMERGVLMSITGLGCLSSPMGDAELESLVETFAAVLAAESAPGNGG